MRALGVGLGCVLLVGAVGACRTREAAVGAPAAAASATSSAAAPAGPGVPRAVRYAASTGPAVALVVILHGYGSNADDLAPIARQWSAVLPSVDFLLPDGIEPRDGVLAGAGRQWWAPGSPEKFPAAVRAASAWIDGELDARHLARDRVIVVGFSQGAMLAERLAVDRAPPVLGAIAYSGRLYPVDPVEHGHTAASILVVHGTADARVPYAEGEASARALTALGAQVETDFEPGLGHSISASGVQRGLDYLARRLQTLPR